MWYNKNKGKGKEILEVLEMKDYKFITITEIGRGWFEVDGEKKRMKKEVEDPDIPSLPSSLLSLALCWI